jgi:membrane protease YdiL (CAAX protease family)
VTARSARLVVLGVTFLAAWAALDRLATSPPTISSALLALGGAGVVLATGEMLLGRPLRALPGTLGLGRPRSQALLVALLVGAAVVGTYLVGAALTGVTLRLRPEWPAVLVAVLLFNGVAEELVWRGFAFGHLRRAMPFRAAVGWSVPLVALTHVPIILGNGALIGLLAVATAAVTCLPFARLWERGGRTIWAPACLHGLIDTWQLLERTYPPWFPIVVVAASTVVPLAVLLVPRPQRVLR